MKPSNLLTALAHFDKTAKDSNQTMADLHHSRSLLERMAGNEEGNLEATGKIGRIIVLLDELEMLLYQTQHIDY